MFRPGPSFPHSFLTSHSLTRAPSLPLPPPFTPPPSPSPQVDEDARLVDFAQLGVDEGITDIVDGLSFVGGSLEAIEAPTQQPEEWTPEVGGRVWQRAVGCVVTHCDES